MKMSTVAFIERTPQLPALRYDMVFVETQRPILFTCIGESGGLYICSCHCANAEKCEWLVAETTPEAVVELLTNRREIREMFPQHPFVWVVTRSQEGTRVHKVNASDVPEDIFPSKGFYMDAEPGEFSVEIEELYRRQNVAHDFDISILWELIQYYNQSFEISLNIPQITRYSVNNRLRSRRKHTFTMECRV